jgi:predicted phosphodiesterase
MRMAVISDVHGNLPALEAVLADVKNHGADFTVNLGDCVTSPLWPKETFEALQSLALPTVRGNHDRWRRSEATRVRDGPKRTSEPPGNALVTLPVVLAFQHHLG